MYQYFALKSTTALEEWITRAQPPQWQFATVVVWMAGLCWVPWQFPSIPIEVLSSRPTYEVRHATIPESNGVRIWYEHHFVQEWNDPIYVG